MVEVKYVMIDKNLIKTYAIDEETQKLYKIRKLGTNEVYDFADDLLNDERRAMGIEPYYYEATDEEVEEDINIGGIKDNTVAEETTVEEETSTEEPRLEAIGIDESASEIAPSIFSGKTETKIVIFFGSEPPILNDVSYLNDLPNDCEFYVPSGSLINYQTETNWIDLFGENGTRKEFIKEGIEEWLN